MFVKHSYCIVNLHVFAQVISLDVGTALAAADASSDCKYFASLEAERSMINSFDQPRRPRARQPPTPTSDCSVTSNVQVEKGAKQQQGWVPLSERLPPRTQSDAVKTSGASLAQVTALVYASMICWYMLV